MTNRSSFLKLILLLAAALLLLLVAEVAGAQEAPTATPPDLPAQSSAVRSDDGAGLEAVDSAPVVIDGVVLFKVRGVSALPAEKRAQVIADRISALAADPGFSREALRIDESRPGLSVLMAGSHMVMGLTDADARLENIERHILASLFLTRVGDAVDNWRHDRTPATLQRNALVALGSTFVLALIFLAGARLFRKARAFLEQRLRQRIHDVQFQTFRVVRAQQLWGVLNGAISLLWVVVVLTAVYLYLSSVLVLFPWTRGLAGDLIELLLNPLRTLGLGFLQAVPKLAFLAVLFFLLRYTLKLVRHFFDNIRDGTVVMASFDPEWAMPTYRLIRLLLIALGVIVAYPYIPGSQSEAFKGVSIFIGVIFSLGSSSVIGNLIAGYTMTYRRVFKAGDRVSIGSYLGDVEQVHLMVTHLRTPKNELVAIPNSTILNSEVVNFSTLARTRGLILHTTVGIGYGTPWRQVEAMLLEAVARTPDLLRDPPPFVRQTALGEFNVTYEINAYCADPREMFRLYTELHRNILDLFNEYGVQIMTPSYEGDPEQPKVVPPERWYTAPARSPEN
ncbi:mechanosensitive ion channel family protein [Propionivibrio limicola]|uniref:mechanosensitive ion channel family protein n=1 Tax=Propionivibrio limicola TaxID=167645 RepID=UPI001291061D|nr:mechanosensitive ion channel domain-containing protein [Propionivibrio limicola]